MRSQSIARLTACMLALLLVAVSVPAAVQADGSAMHMTMEMEDCTDAGNLVSHANHCCLVQIPLHAAEVQLSKPVDYVEQTVAEPEQRRAGTLPDPLFRPPRMIG